MSIKIKNRELIIEQVRVSQIAQAYPTPAYIYSRAKLEKNLLEWPSSKDGQNALFCFALKANDNLELLKIIAKNRFGADVVSGGELFLALKAGFSPERIVFAGVGKQADEIRFALKENIKAFNIESSQELELIHSWAKQDNSKANIHIRVNPDIDAKSHPYISTGLTQNKFGIEKQDAIELAKLAESLPFVELKGIHVHIGSQITEISPFEDTSQAIRELYFELINCGIQIENIDLGGGLGIEYRNIKGIYPGDDNNTQLTVNDYLQAIRKHLQDLPINFIFEPGRAVIANTAILLTTVLYIKKTRTKKFIIVDAGMNDLIRPSLYGAYHHILPISSMDRCEEEVVDVVGPICETGDFFARDRLMPALETGEQVAIFSVGAYGYSLSSNYNGRCRVAEILVDNTNFRIIRRAEHYEDFLKLYNEV